MIYYLISEPFIQVVIFIIGSLMGSFFNVCIYRLPINESIIIPHSHCPNCKTKIKIWENIPIISYIILRGKCRYCKTKISKRYIIVEILTPVLFLLLWNTYGGSIDFAIYLLFISILIIITFIDFEHQLIPNILTYPMVVIGILINFFKGILINSLIAGLVGGGIIFLIIVISPFIFKKYLFNIDITFQKTLNNGNISKELQDVFNSQATIKVKKKNRKWIIIDEKGEYLIINKKDKLSVYLKREGMGGGDLKLATVIGVFLANLGYTFLSLFLASFLGSLVGLGLILLGKKRFGEYIPFGPYLASGAVITLLFGKDIINWYFKSL